MDLSFPLPCLIDPFVLSGEDELHRQSGRGVALDQAERVLMKSTLKVSGAAGVVAPIRATQDVDVRHPPSVRLRHARYAGYSAIGG
jgi:hypothetical protein